MIRQFLVLVDFDPAPFEADGTDAAPLIAEYIEYLLRTHYNLHSDVFLVPEEPTAPAR